MLSKRERREEKGDGRWKMEDGSDWLDQHSGKSPLVPRFLWGESFRRSPPFDEGRLGGIFERLEMD
jgi:hypothetical protein